MHAACLSMGSIDDNVAGWPLWPSSFGMPTSQRILWIPVFAHMQKTNNKRRPAWASACGGEASGYSVTSQQPPSPHQKPIPTQNQKKGHPACDEAGGYLSGHLCSHHLLTRTPYPPKQKYEKETHHGQVSAVMRPVATPWATYAATMSSSDLHTHPKEEKLLKQIILLGVHPQTQVCQL